MRLLVIEDDATLRESLANRLAAEGFAIEQAGDGREGLYFALEYPIDLAIIDLGLPEMSGLDIIRQAREKGKTFPILILTARDRWQDKVDGLSAGADDYVVKPFSPRELAARVRTVLKRSDVQPAPVLGTLEFEGPLIDEGAREVTVDGRIAGLTPKEFELLVFLATSPRQVFSRGQLLQRVWDSNSDWQDPSTVTVHIRRIRQKIESDPESPRWLTTVWGFGYRFEP